MIWPTLTAAVERRLVDRCSIVVDVDGTRDDHIDPDTLELTPPVGDRQPIDWDDIACLIGQASRGNTAQLLDRAGLDLYTETRQLRLPADFVPPPGAIVTVTRSQDAALDGTVWRTLEVGSTSSSGTRIITMAAHTRGPRT